MNKNIFKSRTETEQLFDRGCWMHRRNLWDKAAESYKAACEKGRIDAYYMLAFLYYEGKGVEKDLAECKRCLEIAANNKCEFSDVAKRRLEKLANLESGEGIGIMVQLEHPRLWKRAQNGEFMAQKILAEKLYDEISIFMHPEADGETMIRFLLNLAEQNDIPSMLMLVDVYSHAYVGVGLKYNITEAIKWCKRAAEAGDEYAKTWLECSCRRGRLIGYPFEKNKRKAHMLFKVLSRNKEPKTSPIFEHYLQEIRSNKK